MNYEEKISLLKDKENLSIDYWDIWFLHGKYFCFNIHEDYDDEFIGYANTPEKAWKICITAT